MLIVQNSVFIKKRPNSTSENDTINGERLVFSVNTNSRYLGVIFLCSKNCSSVEITSIMNVLFNKKNPGRTSRSLWTSCNIFKCCCFQKKDLLFYCCKYLWEHCFWGMMMLSVFKPWLTKIQKSLYTCT